MTIQYQKSGDYYLPNLVIEETEHQPIGKYGRMRKRYLKDHRPVLYSNMLLEDKLFQHLAEIDQACENRMELIIRQMKAQEGVTEALKAADQMEWVRRMNSIQNRAEEIVQQELVYCWGVSECKFWKTSTSAMFVPATAALSVTATMQRPLTKWSKLGML